MKDKSEKARKLMEPEPIEDIKALQKKTLDEAQALGKLLKPELFADDKHANSPTKKKKTL